MTFDEMIAELERDPEARKDLIEARQWLAQEFYEPGHSTYERLMRGEGPPPASPDLNGAEHE